MKGWLDKYGKEINANEGHSSASKEWIGEGYSNVGRNYSPAWGGQFQEGGKIPKAQKGKRTPVYVNDPNDPRLKLYSDSASVFKASQNPFIWEGTKPTSKEDYEKKGALQDKMPHWSFDEDQYKKDKKKGIFKDFNDYMYDVGLVDKKDPKALDAYNRNIGKHYQDFDKPIEQKLSDGRIKQYWTKYDGKLDTDYYDIYDPVTGSQSMYGADNTFIQLYNPNIKPIGHKYYAFDKPFSTGETHISSEDSEYVNKVLKNKTKNKKNYTNYTYGANDNEVYKEPVQPVIYNKKKYNPSDPRLKQLQESFDKFHGSIKEKSKEEPKQQEEPSLKKKVTKEELKSNKTNTPGITELQHPDVQIPPIQQGKYRVEYFDPSLKEETHRMFMTQAESDAYADELSKRNLTGVPSAGNITQRVEYQNGGELTSEQLDSLNKAKMKAKMALASEFGNPAARRMMNPTPPSYRFSGNEMIDGQNVVGFGENQVQLPATGTHYMGSMGEYAVPYIQQSASGNLQFNPNASPNDREAMKFDNPQDAEYFAEHYKEVAPMMRNFAMGGSLPGSVGFTYARTGGIPSNGPYAKKTKASAQNGENLHPIDLHLPTYEKPKPSLNPYAFYVHPQQNVHVAGIGAHAQGNINDRLNISGGLHSTSVAYPGGERMFMKPQYHVGMNYKFDNGGSMSYYQHGLDWKPKSMKKGGWLDKYEVPKNQNAEFVLPRFDMPRAVSSSIPNIQEQLKQKGEAEEIHRRKVATEKQQFVGPAKASTPDSEARRKRLNQQYASTLPNAQIDAQGNVSRVNPNRSVTGEAENFMSRREDKAGEHALGALEAAGYATVAGELAGAGYNALKAGLAESMESGVLSNTYKINPWAFKANPEAFYRQIGKTGLTDATESGVIRSADISTFPRPHFVEGKDFTKLYSTGEGATGNTPSVIFETSGINQAGEPFVFPANSTSGYTPWISGQAEIPLSQGKVLQKDWLRGYKEVPKPTSLSSSVETMPPPSQTSIRDWLDDNATFINLERASPKPKSKMYKASEIVEDPNFNIKKIYRGDKETPKVIRVQGKSGEWTVNKSNDGSYYFNAAMSSPLESGKAMLKINEMLPPKPTILEPNSLSLDSYLNTIKLGKRPHWKMEFENYIPLNHSAKNNQTLSNMFGFKPEGTNVPFSSLEDANVALKEVNSMLKKQGITQEADVFSNGNNWYGIKIPNFKLTRDYKKGGVVKDDRGQWAHRGKVTEIQGNSMATHGYGDLPLYVVPDVGEPRMVEANTGNHTFPGATKFTEYPIKKKSKGWLDKYN